MRANTLSGQAGQTVRTDRTHNIPPLGGCPVSGAWALRQVEEVKMNQPSRRQRAPSGCGAKVLHLKNYLGWQVF